MFNFFRNKISLLNSFYILLILGYFFSQIPFLLADADSNMISGRGSWSDEGLNTCQIRNFVNHGHFNLLDCDNFLKTPLFSVFLFPFFKVFGISLLKARLITILYCSSILISFLHNKLSTYIGVVFILTTMLFLPIHQYSHLCLAEMFSSLLIVLAILVYCFFVPNRKKQKMLFSMLLITLSVLFKLQFIYVLGIPILMTSISYIINISSEKKRELIDSIIYLILILSIFLLVWYFPFKIEWKQIAKQQSGSFSFSDITNDLVWYNIKLYFLNQNYQPFTYLFLISFLIGIYQIIYKKYSQQYQALLVMSSCWFLVELHKLGLTYLPIRYLISLYLSMGFLISIVMGNYLFVHSKKYLLIVLLLLISIFIINSNLYLNSFNSRRFTINNANNYINSRTSKNDIIIGPWAPTLTWESQAYCYPIWANFLGNRKIIEYYHPNFIISEFNQDESGSAYEINNIDLNKVSDSIIQLKVVDWNLNIYKVKSNKTRK